MANEKRLIELVNSVLSCLPWGEISSHTAEDVADHLIANGVTFDEDNNVPSKWISVKDRFPEPKENPVLVYYANSVWAAWKHDNYWELVPGINTTCITYWQPMPQPPKGE